MTRKRTRMNKYKHLGLRRKTLRSQTIKRRIKHLQSKKRTRVDRTKGGRKRRKNRKINKSRKILKDRRGGSIDPVDMFGLYPKKPEQQIVVTAYLKEQEKQMQKTKWQNAIRDEEWDKIKINTVTQTGNQREDMEKFNWTDFADDENPDNEDSNKSLLKKELRVWNENCSKFFLKKKRLKNLKLNEKGLPHIFKLKGNGGKEGYPCTKDTMNEQNGRCKELTLSI